MSTIATEPARRRRSWGTPLVAVAAGVVLVVGFFIAWNNGLRDAVYPKNFGVVEPGRLYRSGLMSDRQVEPTLEKYHIQTIVALSAHGGKPAYLKAEDDAVRRLGIDRRVFPLGGDGTGQIEQYAQAIAAIDAAEKANKPVLVHCIAGAQRTGGVIACYEMLVKHAPAEAALKQLESYGHDPSANPHLIPYLNNHMAELANRLIELKVIPSVPSPLPALPVQ